MNSEEIFRRVLPEHYFREFWKTNRRNDGRAFTQLRDITVERLSETSSVINFGGNIVQASCTNVSDKIRLVPTDSGAANDLIPKISIEFEDCPLTELSDTLRYLIANLIVRRYAKVLRGLAQNVILKITLKCLFDNGNLANALCLAALLQFYFNSVKTYAFFLEQFTVYLPIIFKGFNLPDDGSTLWVCDPNAEEENLTIYGKKGSTVLLMIGVQGKKFQMNKLNGPGITDQDFDILEKAARGCLTSIEEPLMNMLTKDEKGLFKIK